MVFPNFGHTMYEMVSYDSEDEWELISQTAMAHWFSDAFAKLGKATFSLVMSVCRLSFCPSACITQHSLDGFS